ncbi:recombinase zinc beta ribbon domain-containing protein [Chloroflexota bacterium]
MHLAGHQSLRPLLPACRTTGTHGSRPFSKDTIKCILKNRFYIGFIGNGNGDWIKAKHSSFLQPSIFEEAQRMREKRNSSRNVNRARAKIYSLSGIARCADCGNTLRSFKGKRRVRLVCNGRLKSGDCTQPSTLLEVYEQQLRAYLHAFTVPVDYQEKILEAQRKLQSAYDVEKQRATLQARLNRIKELYEWGHKTKEEYLTDCVSIQREIRQLQPLKRKPLALENLADFLKNVVIAWDQASQEQRNRLASCLLETVWIKDKKVMAVTPRPEFKPFFDLQYEGLSHYVLHWRPRGASGFDAISGNRILSGACSLRT